MSSQLSIPSGIWTSSSPRTNGSADHIVQCEYDPAKYHIWPADWVFGGALGTDPRADPRWHPTTYEYWDDRIEICFKTQVPLCDDEALDMCTWVAGLGKSFNPMWVIAIRYSGLPQKLPWTYDKETDTLTRVEPKGKAT